MEEITQTVRTTPQHHPTDAMPRPWSQVKRAEADVQEACEDFMKDSNPNVQEKTKSKINTVEEKVTAFLELEQLSNHNVKLRWSCDFIMKARLHTMRKLRLAMSGSTLPFDSEKVVEGII